MPRGIYKRTKETKKKMSEARLERKKELGYVNSPETRRKMSEAKIGKKRPDLIGNKFGVGTKPSTAFKQGHISWLKGMKGYTNAGSFKKGHSMWDSEEYREKVLQGSQKRWLSKEPTSIEKKLYEELKRRGILFERQRLINNHFIVDAYIPSLNLVIEADGDYWHSLDKIKKQDKSKNAYLTKCGFNLLRVTGTEIRNDSFKEKLDERMVN